MHKDTEKRMARGVCGPGCGGDEMCANAGQNQAQVKKEKRRQNYLLAIHCRLQYNGPAPRFVQALHQHVGSMHQLGRVPGDRLELYAFKRLRRDFDPGRDRCRCRC